MSKFLLDTNNGDSAKVIAIPWVSSANSQAKKKQSLSFMCEFFVRDMELYRRMKHYLAT